MTQETFRAGCFQLGSEFTVADYPEFQTGGSITCIRQRAGNLCKTAGDLSKNLRQREHILDCRKISHKGDDLILGSKPVTLTDSSTILRRIFHKVLRYTIIQNFLTSI
jgi:hypothetical protein